MSKIFDEIRRGLEEALAYEKGEADTEAPPLVRNANGELICPGHPKMCLRSGDFAPTFECCCDECDYFLECFPEYQAELEAALKMYRERRVSYSHDDVKMFEQDDK